MTTTLTLIAYGLYLSAITATTLLVARHLLRHAGVFLREGFAHDEPTAASAAGLIKTQFHLTALAAMLLMMAFARGASTPWNTAAPTTPAELFEALSVKIGLMLLLLGAMHFFTLRLVNRVRTTGNLL